MRRHLCTVSCLIGYLLLVAPAHASPSDDLYNAQFAKEAITEITAMSFAELSAFADYLAACAPSLVNADLRAICERSYLRYRIEFARERSLDRLMTALSLFNAISFWEDRAGEHPKTERLREIARGIELMRAWQDAANVTFVMLRAKRH